jgi:hypothetical protein
MHLPFFLVLFVNLAAVLSLSMSTKTIYNVEKSGWTSPQWNWGSASGTGHDCAAICRKTYTTRQSRSSLVKKLYEAASKEARDREPKNFEEVKLVLALAWQNGRWNGSDGGRGGYGEVLAAMADASRYEVGSEDDCSRLLIEDMQSRFHLLDPDREDLDTMQRLFDDLEPDTDAARRRCSALVLKAMGFVENG